MRRIDYDPWGNGISGGAAASERMTFNAQEQDLESGLYDLSDRNLDAAIGAFTRPDRLWNKFPSWSPYHYAYANPVRMTDPTGMQALPIYKDWMGGIGVGIGIGLAFQTSKAIESLLRQPGWTTTADPLPGEVKYPVRILPHAPTVIVIPDNRQLINPPPPIILNADGETDPPKKTVDDLLIGATPGPDTRVKQYIREGTLEDAIDDFKDIVIPESIKDVGPDRKMGILPDDRRVLIRPSSEGSPTIEIQNPRGVPKIKIRYHEP